MKLTKLTPNLMVQDVSKSVDFYCRILEFSLRMAVDQEKNIHFAETEIEKELLYAQIEKDGVEIMLQQQKSMAEDIPAFSRSVIGASVSFYITVENIDHVYEQIGQQVDLVKKIETTWYGMREFYFRDIDGYVLGFAELQAK